MNGAQLHNPHTTAHEPIDQSSFTEPSLVTCSKECNPLVRFIEPFDNIKLKLYMVDVWALKAVTYF